MGLDGWDVWSENGRWGAVRVGWEAATCYLRCPSRLTENEMMINELRTNEGPLMYWINETARKEQDNQWQKRRRGRCNDRGMGARDFAQLANFLGVYWRKSSGHSSILAIVDSSNRYATGRHWITIPTGNFSDFSGGFLSTSCAFRQEPAVSGPGCSIWVGIVYISKNWILSYDQN
jgi:hypothetical protein